MRLTLPIALAVLAVAGCDREGGGASSTSTPGYSVGDDERIILRVDGKEVPEARLQAYAPPGTEINEGIREQLVGNIVISELLSKQALESGLGDDVAVREKLEVARQTVLSQAFIERLLIENVATETEMEERYDEIVKEFEGKKEYKARHILVEDEDEAREIIEELAEDMDDFGEIAREESTDSGSGQRGGDLGWATPDIYVPEFSEAMVALEVGGLTAEPVKSDFGWHIITLDEVRDVTVPEYDDEMRNRITSTLQNEMVSSYLDNLRGAANVEILDDE